MQAPAGKSSDAGGRSARFAALTILCVLWLCGFGGAQALAQTAMPGRILSAAGSLSGGIIEFNPNATNVVHLSPNTFDSGCTDERAHKSTHPSSSRDGRLIAFSSNRDRAGAVGGAFRIFVMNGDGAGVRQLTTSEGATTADGTTADDLRPVISPDGSRVAFISKRNSPTDDIGLTSIFIVNTDGGGGIRQVTFPQTDNECRGCANKGAVYSVVWSPDGTRLAFKGQRLAADTSNTSPNFHSVVGLINADGTGETTLAVVDSTGVWEGIDWSPDGRHIVTPYGREGQGAPPFRVIIFDLQTNTSREILQEGNIPGGSVSGAAGALRFSPDGQRLALTTRTVQPQLLVTDLNGAQQSLADIPTSLDPPLWWQAGAAIPTPDRLELTPNRVVVRAAGPAVQLLPALFDAAGNVISRAATGWRCENVGGVLVSHVGLVGSNTDTRSFTGQVCAGNGGKQACADVSVNPATNRIDEPEFFTSYQYFDFLGRTPDPPGLAFWTGNITECGPDAGCAQAMRVNVSAAFFLSIEFQETGYLVYRLYKAAFGDLPAKPIPFRLAEFLPDTQKMGEGVVVNQGDWRQRLEQNKQDFIAAFVLRPRFLAAYPSNMTAAEFVDKLNRNAGRVLDPAERSQLISEMGHTPGDAQKRASVLRKVAENQTLKDVEFRKAFVLMQYFGYLRRNPDDAPDADFSGYNFWLGKLNEFNGDYIKAEMVRAFIESLEYRKRFGP